MSLRRALGLAWAVAMTSGCVDTSNLAGGDASANASSGSPADAAPALVEISPASLDLPEADCGTTTKGTFVVINRSATTATLKVTSIDEAFVVTRGASGTIPPNGVANVEVSATPRAQGDELGTLVVDVDGKIDAYLVKARGRGPTIELSQTEVDFGLVRKENGGRMPIAIRNGGDRALDLSFQPESDSPDFDLTPSSLRIEPDGKVDAVLTMKPGPSMATDATARLVAKATGVCGALPTIGVRGRRVTTDVTVDVVDWGDVGCKSAPADRDAVIKNYGPSPFTFTSTFTGAGFNLVGATSGTVPAGAETAPAIQRLKVHVTPTAPTGQKEGTLGIVPSTTGSPPVTTKVRAFVYGLELTTSPSTATFNSTGNTESRKTFTISNAGKFGGTFSLPVTYAVTGAGFRTENGTTAFQNFLGLGASGKVDVVFKATQTGTVNGSLTVNGAAVCSQNAVTLTGTNP